MIKLESIKKMIKLWFINELIAKGYMTKAVGRLVEWIIYSGVLYVLTVFIDREIFSARALWIVVFTPLAMYISKKQRDIQPKVD